MSQSCACGCGESARRTFVKGHNRRVALQDRLAAKTVITPTCWLWTGPPSANGYGRVAVGRRYVQAHRASYEVHVGPIPAGLELDHLCHTEALATSAGGPSCPHRLCVNPAHLRPATQLLNILTGLSPSARNARKTHCDDGHEFAGTNLIVMPDGRRRCRLCENARQRTRRAAKRKSTA
jgi:hypothetical protein